VNGRVRCVPLLVTAVLAALLAGCHGPPPTRVEFNNNLADRNAKLYKAGRAFRKTLDPLLKDGRSADVAAVKKARDDARAALEDVSSEFKDSRTPRKGGNAQAIWDAYNDFLATEDDIVNKYFAEIIQVLEDDKEYPSNSDKKAKILAILKKIDKEEADKMGVVYKEQKSYADAFNFTVQGAPAAPSSQPGAGDAAGGSGKK
jgi:cytochrome c556